MSKSIIATAAIAASLLLASCDATSPGAPKAPIPSPAVTGSANDVVKTSPGSASSVQIPSRIGAISIVVPTNYGRLSLANPAYFERFKVLSPNLEVVEVFVTDADLELTRKSEALRDQIFQLQLFGTDAPPVDDEAWKAMRLQIPALMSGKRADELLNLSEGPAADRYNSLPNGGHEIISINVGQVVVYSVSDRDVRWMAKAALALQKDGTPTQYSALVASALVRKGNQIVMLQSTTQVQQPDQEQDVRRRLDEWVSSIR